MLDPWVGELGLRVGEQVLKYRGVEANLSIDCSLWGSRDRRRTGLPWAPSPYL